MNTNLDVLLKKNFKGLNCFIILKLGMILLAFILMDASKLIEMS